MKLCDYINNNIKKPTFSLFIQENTYKEFKNILSPEEQNSFELIYKSSIIIATYNEIGEVKFGPIYSCSEGRTFSIEDYSEEDFDNLKKILKLSLPCFITAKIADIIWTAQNKGNYDYALIAASNYRQFFDKYFQTETRKEALIAIKRCICIYTKLGKKNDIKDNCQTLYNILEKINCYKPYEISLMVLEILIQHNYDPQNKVLLILDDIIQNAQNDIYTIEECFELKLRYLSIKKQSSMETKLELASIYDSFSEKLLAADKILEAAHYKEKSIQMYRDSNNRNIFEKKLKELTELQSKTKNYLTPIRIPIKIPPELIKIIQNFNNMTFIEALICFIDATTIYSREKIKNMMFEHYKKCPLQALVNSVAINNKGQYLFKLHGLDLENPEEDVELLNQYLWKFAYDLYTFEGVINRHMQEAISNTFVFTYKDLLFLTQNSHIIPPGREEIIQTGVYFFLKGHYFESYHILAPQVEAMLRYMAEIKGANVTAIEADGTVKQKLLSSIFDLQELKDNYDNNLLFTLRGLMNEKTNGNIRNRIAHGIFNKEEADSGIAIYFGSIVIKLLTMYSSN